MYTNMKTQFIQVNCVEGRHLDLRQARAVLKYSPDLILLESPNDGKSCSYPFNRYLPKNKPLRILDRMIENLEEAGKRTPWVRSDIAMWQNVAFLWKQGKQVLLFRLDGPRDLVVRPVAEIDWGRKPRDVMGWVRIYLREKFMAKHFDEVLARHSDKKICLVFLQSLHWEGVRLLSNHPSKARIWKRYFGRFKGLNPNELAKLVKSYPVLWKYWRKLSDFR